MEIIAKKLDDKLELLKQFSGNFTISVRDFYVKFKE